MRASENVMAAAAGRLRKGNLYRDDTRRATSTPETRCPRHRPVVDPRADGMVA